MAKSRSPNRDKAFEIYKEKFSKITANEIAVLLNEKKKNIEYWKAADDWTGRYNPQGGAPKGNQNASGHIGMTPKGNQNARKIGWYSKYMPKESINIIRELEESNASTIDILWAQITTQYAAIIRAQKIMFVKNQEDTTKELKKFKNQRENIGSKGEPVMAEIYREEEYEIQFAWDKQATFLTSQSRAMSELRSLIKNYEDMLKDGLTTEEQRLRIERLKVGISTTKQDIVHRKEINKQKLKLEREKFEHGKEMDEMKNF